MKNSFSHLNNSRIFIVSHMPETELISGNVLRGKTSMMLAFLESVCSFLERFIINKQINGNLICANTKIHVVKDASFWK